MGWRRLINMSRFAEPLRVLTAPAAQGRLRCALDYFRAKMRVAHVQRHLLAPHSFMKLHRSSCLARVKIQKTPNMPTQNDKGQESPGLGSLQPTANKTGFDFGVPTYRFQTWVDSYDGQHPLLDVGCGLGTNTLTALKAGASVFAVDASEEHLEQLRKKAPEAVKSGKLQTAVGDIPDGPVLPPGHYSGVLCAQLIHFLRPSQIPATFEMLYSVVKPGGSLVLTCSSAYQLPEASGLIPKVEDAVNKDPASFPGWFLSTADFKDSWSKNHTAGVDEVVRNAMPDSLHVFLPAQVEHQARAAGFEVVECGVVAGEKCGMPKELSQSEDSPYAGKEDVYLVARKLATGRPPSS